MSGTEAASLSSRGRDEKLVAGKYRLERTLGEGGMGVVYAAQHVDLQKRVAIKIMREELTSQVELVERMMAEARTVARLRSEHIAQVIDVGRLTGGAPFIVMEYLDGCDLNSKLLESERLPVDLTVGYVMQACEAVAEAHAAGIVHRDIKPENLFLSARTDGEPIIKVLDFGISRSMKGGERDAADSLIAGSPDYMSPESMQADARVEGATDIWSLGAVLYELLTGRRPFEAATISETCARVLASDPIAPSVLLPTIPAGLESVVLRCLRKNPRERFASVVDLAAALVPFGPEGSLEQAQRVARVAAGGRWNPRNAPKVPRLASYTDVPNSNAAVVADRDAALTTDGVPARPRWQTALLGLAGAAATAVVLIVGAQRAAPTHSRVAAVAAPPVVDSGVQPERAAESAAARPTAASASASAAVPARAPVVWKRAMPRPGALAPKPSASFSYDDDSLASASAIAAPAASASTAPTASALTADAGLSPSSPESGSSHAPQEP